MDTEKLIELVKKHEFLYNPKCQQYRDQSIRVDAWKKIAKVLNATVYDCKSAWTKLRNCHTNALNRRIKRRGKTAYASAPWKYESQMKFLLPHITTSNQSLHSVGNDLEADMVLCEERNESDESSITPSKPVLKTKAMKSSENDPNLNTVLDIMKASLEQKLKRNIMNEMDLFFFNMSQTVKKFPKLDQARIKMDLYKKIHETELRLLKEHESTITSPVQTMASGGEFSLFLPQTCTRTSSSSRDSHTDVRTLSPISLQAVSPPATTPSPTLSQSSISYTQLSYIKNEASPS